MPRTILTYLFLIIAICLNGQGVTINIIDSVSQYPISNAWVHIEKTSISGYTNSNGQLEIGYNRLLIASDELDYPTISFRGSIFSFQHELPSRITIYNALGQKQNDQLKTDHQIDFAGFPAAVYLVCIEHSGLKYKMKVLYSDNKVRGNPLFVIQQNVFRMTVEKDGYQTGYCQFKGCDDIRLSLSAIDFTNEDYFITIDSPEQFSMIEGVPLNPYFGEVTSVKFIYEIETGKMYFINSNRHRAHSYFAMAVLDYPKDNSYFNLEQYKNNPNRLYYPGTIDFFKSSNTYVLQFFASDDISCMAISKLYERIKESCYFSDQLYFYANTSRTQACGNMKVITSEELFNGQNYQCLNPEETYGYLRKVDFEQLATTELGRHDLLLLNGLPVDVPVVAGLITTEFQTPLSHINVLSINRKTPNMVLRNGWNNTDLLQYENKLVYLKTDFESFEIREATLMEAQLFWNTREPKSPVVLLPDSLTVGLIELADLSINRINLVGAKAANFGELAKIKNNSVTLPLPEGAFAIPFFYYFQHMKTNGLDLMLEEFLADETFKNNPLARKDMLGVLQQKIIAAPANAVFIDLVEKRILQNQFKETRFRSSTNAEDIDGFNGAGLYESKTGILGDEKKSVEEAIKKVWASLWNFKAFEEREYFKIDQHSVAMAILAHHAFGDEEANGVLITKNIYRDGLPAYTINCQFGEISVVSPQDGWQPEQLLYYTFASDDENPINYISYSNVPGFENQRVLTDAELQQLYNLTQAIIQHYWYLGIYSPLDIEFKIDKDLTGTRKLYFKQCRIFNG